MLLFLYYFNIHTKLCILFIVPSGTVQNIQTSSDSTVLRINWTQPIAINDVIVIYYVTVSTGGVILYITQTSNESIVFSGLNPNTEYEVVVTPSNSVGNGTSTTVIVRTQQGNYNVKCSRVMYSFNSKYTLVFYLLISRTTRTSSNCVSSYQQCPSYAHSRR